MALTSDSALSLVYDALKNLNAERSADSQIPLSMDTALFGGDSLLDSLALVSVISDVEMAVSDAVGEAVSLTDDKALSQPVSPFSSVRTLVAYMLEVTGGKA